MQGNRLFAQTSYRFGRMHSSLSSATVAVGTPVAQPPAQIPTSGITA
jgi:hypothetical protein